jgi:hypothetical protein
MNSYRISVLIRVTPCDRINLIDSSSSMRKVGKQEFRRTDFGSRLLEAEGEGEGGSEGEGCV